MSNPQNSEAVIDEICKLRMDNLDAKIESGCRSLDIRIENHSKVNELEFDQLRKGIAAEFRNQTKVVTVAVAAIGFVIMVIDFLFKFIIG